MSRPLVIHADDLGLSRGFNEGIRDSATRGLLTSTCVRVNGSGFDEAVRDVVPSCPQLGIGLHLNIVEGKTTRDSVPKGSRLCRSDGTYALSFPALLYRQRDPTLLEEIERDYRDQLEVALRRLPQLDHINSHQHSHAVPALFDLVCRLALEYGIGYVRLPREPRYVAGPLRRHLRPWYGANQLKVAILNALAGANAATAADTGVLTNEWLVGIAYTGHMTMDTVLRGLDATGAGDGVVELLLHPARRLPDGEDRYLTRAVESYVADPARVREIEALTDPKLSERLAERGWDPTCYRCLSRGAVHSRHSAGQDSVGGVGRRGREPGAGAERGR